MNYHKINNNKLLQINNNKFQLIGNLNYILHKEYSDDFTTIIAILCLITIKLMSK